MSEIIEHGVNGFLAKNYEEFKYYMGKVDDIDPAACRESVKQRFSAATMATEYLKRYQQVIQLNKAS
jgi:glycosyltransferase involved in cell wall biosynthesis